MRKTINAIIKTVIATVMLCGIWNMLEIFIYGYVQPRIVDNIMIILFIPFIYLSAKE